MWLVINLVLDVRLLGSLLMGHSDVWLLGSLLLGCSNVWLLRGFLLGRSDHLLLALIKQSPKKSLLLVSGGRSALQTKTMVKYIK